MTTSRETETSPRVFSIAEVNALLPALSQLVAEQLLEQSAIEQGLGELTRLTGSSPTTLKAAASDPPEVERRKRELRQRVGRYEAGWRKVQSWGGVVKDPRAGLVDFYGRIEGKLVWLCWRYGEESVGYYHDLDSGYAGRRPLTPEVRRTLLN
jgi:hypothetical protein